MCPFPSPNSACELAPKVISVEVDAPCAGAFVGPGGRTLAKGEGTRFTYRAGAEDYVRFEAEGKTGRIFLQPMFGRN